MYLQLNFVYVNRENFFIKKIFPGGVTLPPHGAPQGSRMK